ncbi:MAG: DUF2948 family protein [Rhodobiaceae bacterium]|jgi:hypothetical protein|nr:DUF2948 family protein [Rhodobiaceae bacterium]MBT5517347.1 DUF2948 family protein [Rhodobiaceae bacterium]MBT7279181.1 DUF2948 family protein [Rhodobiaceae bacterium]MDG2496127.1 DUF2948 family protein [Alphaproteobacteria bacterium]
MPVKPLKLYARDGDDMKVVSACLQDSVAQIGDMTYLEGARRFVILVNRFCWERDGGVPMRVRSALQISGVEAIQQRQLNLTRRDGIVSILAVQFEPTESPSGVILLVFSGGGEIRLEVEACEAILEDVTAPWAAASRPAHAVDTKQETE